MVDFIKVMLPPKYQSILECNEHLNFTEKINTTTGEIVSRHKIAYYKNMKFEIYNSGNVFIGGSLHKLFNDGKHNYNDFSIDCFLSTVRLLESRFNIDTNDCQLKCLEIGINVVVPYSVDKIINYSILHRKISFEAKYNSAEGNYKQCVHSQYYIKLYNKTKHFKKRFFDVPDDLLRFEIKYNKMEKLNRMGVHSLNDLKRDVLLNFKEVLLLEWGNILFYDFTTQIDHLKENTRLKIERYDSLNYWNVLLQGTNENYKYHKNQLKKYVCLYSKNVQKEIHRLIGSKFDELINHTTRIDHLYIVSNKVAKNKKRCIVTNTDISMQKDNSYLLSHTGLWYLYYCDQKSFLRIRNQYLSVKWKEDCIKIQIREISHSIRNIVNNIRIRNKVHFNNNQLSLF